MRSVWEEVDLPGLQVVLIHKVTSKGPFPQTLSLYPKAKSTHRLSKKCSDLQATALAQPGDSPTIITLKAEAQKAIEAAELARADTLLADVEDEQRRGLDRESHAFAMASRMYAFKSPPATAPSTVKSVPVSAMAWA